MDLKLTTTPDDPDGDNMAAGLAAGFFQAAAKVERTGALDDAAEMFEEYANDHAFCLAVAKQMMEDSK